MSSPYPILLTTMTGLALLGKTSGNAGFSAEMCSDKPHASTMDRDFAVSFRPEWKFAVLDRETVAKNPAYMAFHQKYTDGWQSRPPSHGGQYECYKAEGILDPFPIRNLSVEERASLMKSLGVDRLAVAEVETHVENTSVLKGPGLLRHGRSFPGSARSADGPSFEDRLPSALDPREEGIERRRGSMPSMNDRRSRVFPVSGYFRHRSVSEGRPFPTPGGGAQNR